MKKNLFLLSLIAIACCFNTAFASSTGTTMPWESGLTTLKESLTGPVASAIAIIGIIASGGMLIFGGEISGFMKSIVYLVLVIALIIGANSMLSAISGNTSSGALITENTSHNIVFTHQNNFEYSIKSLA